MIDAFESVYITIMSNTQKSLEKSLGLIIDWVIDQNINILKYSTLADSRYIKLLKELNHSKVWLIFQILMIMNV